MKRILTIDPGADRVGWAIVDVDNAGVACDRAVISFGTLHPPADADLIRWSLGRCAGHPDLAALRAELAARPVHVVGLEVPPPKVQASSFAGNTQRALVVQGRVGAALATGLMSLMPDAVDVVHHAGQWRTMAANAMIRGGFLYSVHAPFCPSPGRGEKPTPSVPKTGPASFAWACGHKTGFGAEWCTTCAPVTDTRTKWKAAACTVVAHMLGPRWDAFAEPVRRRSRSAVRDHQRVGLHDAAEAVLHGLGIAETLCWNPSP